MAREPIPTWFFVVVVVRKGDKFLLVHERKHGQKWYLPAGRIEPREDFNLAGCRETLEETGVPVRMTGFLGIQHTPMFDGSARVRFIVTAEPVDDTPPKSEPDEESLGAGWFTMDEMRELPLRGEDVLQLVGAVLNGASVFPVNLVVSESPLYFGGLPPK
jgi:8-oxo-dGTP pyrophosphatase MutT (NUDIX family)